MRTIWVEDLTLLEELGYMGNTELQLQRACTAAGLYFSVDDMGDMYISRSEDCMCFEEVEE